MAEPDDSSSRSDSVCSSGIISNHIQYGNVVLDTEIEEGRISNAILRITSNHNTLPYFYKFLRDVCFAVFADNVSSTKIKSSKIYNSIDTVLCQNPVILEK